MRENEKIGFDLVDNKPDYTKTKEENIENTKKKYEEVYGKEIDKSDK